jgi:uncharacterized membrane protein SirB2
MYATLKAAHVTCVIASGAGFIARGVLAMLNSSWLRTRFARIAPHVVDTLLLASAIAMAVLARLAPTQQPWLLAKIVALLGYIVLGSIALRYGRTGTQRALAFAAALLVFAYIVAVAITRSPAPGL